MSDEVLRVAFVIQSVAIVLGTACGVVLMRRLVRLWATYLDLAARHSALTKDAASGMTQRILAAVEKVPAASATKVLEGQASVGVPPAPRSLKDSCKVLLAGTFLFLGAGSVALDSSVQQARGDDMDAAECLRKGHYEQAVHHAEKSGEALRKAEALILMGRLDEAEALCAADGCGQSKFLLGVVADKKGFPDTADRLYQEAAELGSEQAKWALAADWSAE